MLHFLGADLIRLSHVRGDWWIRGKREWINFKWFFKKKRVRPTFAQITVLISISSLKGDTCRGWQVVWREMNEIRGKRGELYNTTCSLIYLWELNWVWIHTSESKIASACWNSLAFQMCCGGNRPRPYKCWTRNSTAMPLMRLSGDFHQTNYWLSNED